MKKVKVHYFLLFSVCCIFILDMLFAQEWENYDRGKVRGWIIDPETKKPVNQVFKIEFSDAAKPGYLEHKFRTGAMTDASGYFETYLHPLTYLMKASPSGFSNKYCIEPHPQENENFKFLVNVEKGKVIEIKKTATIGGRIKAKIIDLNGNCVNLQERFKGIKLSPRVSVAGSYTTLSGVVIGSRDDDLLDGEMITIPIFPDKYTARLEMIGLGYTGLEVEDIQVEKGDTTVVEFKIDPNDSTGLEGRIFDKAGNIIKNKKISLLKYDPYEGTFTCYSNDDGYYCIRGLLPGKYKIQININWNYWKSNLIEVKKGVLSKKDIYIDIPNSN